MPSPLFDNLHLKLARNINDPVGASTKDGKLLTSAARSDLLNRANRFIQQTLWKVGLGTMGKYIPGLITTQSFTFASAGTAVNSDYGYYVSCEKTPGVELRWVDPSRKISLDRNSDPLETRAFTILGGKIFGYYNGTQLTSGAGLLYYVKTDIKNAADASDLSIDSIWHDPMVEIATLYYRERIGQVQNGEIERTKIVGNIIG